MVGMPIAADIQAPERVFGFFTIVAGMDVLRARLEAAGHPVATAILAALAAVVWLVLNYGVPASLLLMRERDSVLGGVNGTWPPRWSARSPCQSRQRPWPPSGRRS